MKKLADITTLRNGFSFRGRIESENTGDTLVIQVGDISEDGVVDTSKLACIHLGSKASKYLVGTNEVLYVSRGSRQRAYKPVFTTVTEMPVITVFGILVLSPDLDQVTPEYLTWVLNSAPVEHAIKARTEGTNLTFISDKNLKDVAVPLPDLQTQKKISHLLSIHSKRKSVRKKLAEIDEKIMQSIVLSMATGKTK